MAGVAVSAVRQRPGEVQLWLLPREPDWLDNQCRTGLGLLSGAERERLERTANGAVARRFLLGRVLMRRALGAYLEVDPASLVIVPEPLGKARLVEPESPDLVFNLSHSRSDWAFALAQGDGLGIDLEPIGRGASMARIACGFYSAPERQRLSRQSNDAGTEALQLWTLKEAVVKALGRTVWEGMRDVRLAIDRGRIRWLAPPPEGEAVSWSVALGRLREDHWLALALKSAAAPPPTMEVSCHALDGRSSGQVAFCVHVSTKAT